MFTARSFVIVVYLATVANGDGIGKAWEVSPIQNTDNLTALSSRPRLESSAFEVRSVSGIGRLAPVLTSREQYSTVETPNDETIGEISQSPEKSVETSLESLSNLRLAKELDEPEDAVGVFVPVVEFHDPTIEEFFGRSSDMDEIEALPSVWRKFRAIGRNGRNHGGHCSEVGEIDVIRHDDSLETSGKKPPRVRREAETEMEKIGESKSAREGRLDSSESWSKQPLSVEFRRRTKLEEAAEELEKSSRSTARGIQAPHVDFVTSNRRSFTENRESRDMPMTLPSVRSYDEMPNYRNTLRDRDLDAPYTRHLFYPERYRTERDYFVRGPNEPSYRTDRYRGDIDSDIYGRSRPLPKQKRIIYYATLPEVVRKPVDMRTYTRPYDPLARSSNAAVTSDGYYNQRSVINEPARYRYYAYPRTNYGNYDIFGKRPSSKERAYDSYAERIVDSRRREQDHDHASMRDNSRNEESMLELGQERKIPERADLRDREKLPWPVQIGTEVGVKENERITGRKIFGQRNDYDRFRNGGRAERDREQSGTSDDEN